jgi:hypothetical protein
MREQFVTLEVPKDLVDIREKNGMVELDFMFQAGEFDFVPIAKKLRAELNFTEMECEEIYHAVRDVDVRKALMSLVKRK